MVAKKKPVKKKALRKQGRPTKFTKALGAKICERLADGESLRSITSDLKMPPKTTVLRWVFEDIRETEGFRDQYDKARQMQAETYADELNEISDDGRNDWMERNGYEVTNPEAIQRSKLRVDTRKWVASRILHKYRDKQDTKVTHDGTIVYKPIIKRFDGSMDEE